MPAIRNIRSIEELDRLLADSDRVPVWIFKHSLACGVSSHALGEFERFVDSLDPDDPAQFVLVEIQQTPEVSQQVASRTGVRHESPQLIFLRQGRVVWEASHWAIRRHTLEQRLEEGRADEDGAASEGVD